MKKIHLLLAIVLAIVLALVTTTIASADGPQCDVPDLGLGGWEVWIGESDAPLYLPYNLTLKPSGWTESGQVSTLKATAWPSDVEPEVGSVSIVSFALADDGWHIESYHGDCPTESEIGIAWATLTTLNGGTGEEWDAFENWWAGMPYYRQLRDFLEGNLTPRYLFPTMWSIQVSYRTKYDNIEACFYGDSSWEGCFSVSVDTGRIRLPRKMPVTLLLILDATAGYLNNGSVGNFANFGWTPSLESYYRALRPYVKGR